MSINKSRSLSQTTVFYHSVTFTGMLVRKIIRKTLHHSDVTLRHVRKESVEREILASALEAKARNDEAF